MVNVGVAVALDAQIGPIAGSDFSYLGAFRLAWSGDWCSCNLDGLGVAPDGGLWVTDRVYRRDTAGMIFTNGFENGGTSAWGI